MIEIAARLLIRVHDLSPEARWRLLWACGIPPIAGGAEFTDYLESTLVDEAFRAVAFAPVADVYAALFTAAPGETGGGTEVTGGSYAREIIAFGAGSQVSGAYQVSNSATETFPTATANWGTVTHTAIIDAAAAGNYYGYTPLDTNVTVNNGDTARFSANALKVQLA